uniref:Putative junctional adhesion molecule A n=1 Tax=Sciaenops ocellatus TaxID=76340 RepID=A0A076VG76_SCIOC|nr:putative junctional adhesion molecule A [Sciaenops ocellatus]
MAVWDRGVLWVSVVFTFLLTGAVGEHVKYPPPVCAVKGSTVTLPCTFEPVKSNKPDGKEVFAKIVRVVWCQNHLICHGSTPSVYDSDSTNNNPRYKYLGDQTGDCTLQITDIQTEDNKVFRFRMEAEDGKSHHTEQSGVSVTVVDDVQVNINGATGDFRAGEAVTLSCTARCTFHKLEVTWFKDGHALPETGPALRLSSLAAKDSGNYTCSLKMSADRRSLPYRLHVEPEKEEKKKTEKRGVNLIIGVVFGVLLALVILIMAVFIIKRKWTAAHKDQRAVGGDVEQKHPVYSNVLSPAQQGGGDRQEVSQAVEEVSYASVQFRHKNQNRRAEEEDDSIVYSSVAVRR